MAGNIFDVIFEQASDFVFTEEQQETLDQLTATMRSYINGAGLLNHDRADQVRSLMLLSFAAGRKYQTSVYIPPEVTLRINPETAARLLELLLSED